MSNLIEHNAYRIFGLDNGANQKDVLKRYKEIINRLKIDDYPEYDLDIVLPPKLRTEDSVNDALKRLQNVKNNIKEYFFWFQISDTVDEKVLTYLRNKEFNKAILAWKAASETKNSTALFYKKNLAVLYCLLLSNEQNQTYLKESLAYWSEIVISDKFWVLFEKSYSMSNDQTTSKEMIFDFRKNITKYISDIYTDLYHQYKDPKYVKDFQEFFRAHGEKTEKSLLKPLYQSIYNTIDELKKIEFNDEESAEDDGEEEEESEGEDKCANCGDTESPAYWDYVDGSLLCDKCHKKIGNEWQKKVDESIKPEDKVEEVCDYCGKTNANDYYSFYDGSLLCKKCNDEYGREWRKKIRAEEGTKQAKITVAKMLRVMAKLDAQLNHLRKTGLYEDNQSKVVRDHVAEAIRTVSVSIHNNGHMYNKSAEVLKRALKICGTESMKEKCENDLKQIKKNAKDDEKNALVVEIPRFWNNENITFKNNFMEYGRKKMYYHDVQAISYHGVTNTTYGVKTSSKYSFIIVSSNDEITFSFSNDENLWGRLINIVEHFIEPLIVQKLAKLIFEKETVINIGDVSFDKEGYHRSKFWGGVESVFWSDTIYIPLFQQGKVLLLKQKDGGSALFSSISMEVSNAVVLPALLKACVVEYNLRNQE